MASTASRSALTWIAVLLAAPAAAQDAAGAAGCAAEAPCAVELPVYLGWRVYNARCAACHAEDAVGSSFAPDLTRRIDAMDRRAFERALDARDPGPHDVTGPAGADPEVARYYAELWAYLEARASGALPPGPLRPRRRE